MHDAPLKTDPLLTDLRYLPYLPLIYVAWADGALAWAEVAQIRELAARELAPGIDDEPVLAGWLDPAAPPSSTRLLALLRRIREAAARMPAGERAGLAELGLALSRAEGQAPMPSVARAVSELEVALGVAGAEAARALLAEGASPAAAPAPAPAPPAFDVGTMTRLLDGRHHPIRNRVRDLLASGRLRRPDEPDRAAYRAHVLAQLHLLADEGFGALAYPEVTGASPDLGDFIAAFEGFVDLDLNLVVKMGVQFGLFGGSVYFLGTERHRAILPDAASLALPGCFAMTETGHGSNVRALGTTATFDREADAWVLHTPDRASWKDYIGNAALHARAASVFAQLEIDGEGHGVHAFLVPIRGEDGAALPGVTIEDCGPKMGLNGIDNGRLAFDQVRIPRDALLDRYASVDREGRYSSPIQSPNRRFFTMLGTLVGGRVSVAAAGVAAARSALAIAIRYGERRRQFGPEGGAEVRLMDYQTHQRRLMPALAEAYALTLASRDLLERYVGKTEETARELESLAAGFKATATWFATRTIQTARECCGGAGYLSENRFADLKADSDVFTTFEGDNTVLMQLAARGVLTAFQSQFGDNRIFGVVRYLYDRAAAEVSELDPISRRRTDRDHLRDPDAQLRLLQHREDQLTWSAAGRIRHRVQSGMDSFQAVIECQDHLMALGSAWIERHVLEVMSARIDAAEAPEIRAALSTLRDLYALSRLEADQAWFLRHGVLSADKARAIREEVHALCAEVRAMDLALVDAFAIPEAALGAPIAAAPG